MIHTRAGMAPLAWSAEHDTGHPQIDADHRQLLILLNKIAHAVECGSDRAMSLDAIEQLISHTSKHFALEEQLMRQHRYPEYSAHLAKHERLALEIQALQHRYSRSEIDLNSVVFNLLRDWLLNHVEFCDKKLVAFLGAC
ncbi:MAG: hemerythrin [Proteobacteria bacterium]|nr:hemerythrin [Pseudomonadota bacterium]